MTTLFYPPKADFHWKPSVANEALLPLLSNQQYDLRFVVSRAGVMFWDGSAWISINRDLEEKNVTALWYASIASGTTGQITTPTGATIILDSFGDGVDSLTSKIGIDGLPNWESPTTSIGTVVSATMDGSGNYTLSGSPSTYPFALVYRYSCKLKNFDYLKSLEFAEQTNGVNIGALGASVFAGKVAGDFQFKKIKAGLNTTISETSDTITVSSSGGGGGGGSSNSYFPSGW